MTARIIAVAGAMVFVVAGGRAQTDAGWTPPRFAGGALPASPVLAVSGGEVLLEATIGANGQTTGITVLRSTPPFTDAALAAVNGWRFQPAETEVAGAGGSRIRQPVPSRVLIAYVARPPTLIGPTLGEPAADVEAPSEAVAFPVETTTPVYPPQARDAGVVLVEIEVDAIGNPADTTVIRSAAGFDAAALDAARAWRFRPAQIDGLLATTYAYLVFAWQPPVTPVPSPF